ncbi:siderophore ferric iron reductase [Hydrogenophaga palleronii]|uniref:Siderophore ferric iron reductase n=1 Tax=Hydrogenophaga palleronii TaxID=65655 RepID=A0ABU1WR55_9BURK|nr:(2Fe-2S)-binding protein [Hydrogenophaga palleronii]MDR7151664.1 siderophore ferric iron reductase [Hydrogenophaga palleronii]
MPALHGSIHRGASADQAASAAQLVTALQGQYPEAGRAYWALRAWGLLVWQPAYASVIAAELAEGVLPLAGLQLDVDTAEADVSGFAVAAGHFIPCTAGPRRQQAARQLQPVTNALLRAVQAHLPLHPKAARRLLADCVLAALLRIQRWTRHTGYPGLRFSNAALIATGADWLGLLGAGGDSGYLVFDAGGGTPQLALDRRVCCLDDRRHGGSLCDTCPRLARAERLRRLQAASLADAPTHQSAA